MNEMSAFATQFWEDTLTSTPHCVAPCSTRLPVSLDRLLNVLAENGEDDYGAIGPNQFAFFQAFRLVAEAIAILGEDFPASPAVDSQGGIRVTWKRGDRQVKLVCPSQRDMPVYIHYSSPSGNGLRNEGISAAELSNRLDWLRTLPNCES